MKIPVTQHGLISKGMDQGIDRHLEKLFNEFHDVLGMSATGEALTIVRVVHDMNGMAA